MQRSERLTAAFEWPILVASLLVIPTMAIENAGLSSGVDNRGNDLNWLIWIAFVTEFVVLLAVAPNRRHWLFKHPLELAIIVLTPPFWPSRLAIGSCISAAAAPAPAARGQTRTFAVLA